MFDATASTDRLVELILQEDSDVFKQLLTTDKVVTTGTDNVYFGKRRSRKEASSLRGCGEKGRRPKRRRRRRRSWRRG